MFKRILFSLSLLGVIASFNSLPADIDAYANFYSTDSQELTYGEPAVFESQNEVKKFSISDDRKTIICRHKGVYLITFNAIGERIRITQNNPNAPLNEPSNGLQWGVALTLNGILIPGSSVNLHPDDQETQEIVGQVIVELKKNDQIRLVNNTHDEGNELSIAIIGGEDGDISASIVLVNLDD